MSDDANPLDILLPLILGQPCTYAAHPIASNTYRFTPLTLSLLTSVLVLFFDALEENENTDFFGFCCPKEFFFAAEENEKMEVFFLLAGLLELMTVD